MGRSASTIRRRRFTGGFVFVGRAAGLVPLAAGTCTASLRPSGPLPEPRFTGLGLLPEAARDRMLWTADRVFRRELPKSVGLAISWSSVAAEFCRNLPRTATSARPVDVRRSSSSSTSVDVIQTSAGARRV